MKLAVTQPNFLPWLGYFDLLDAVDKIIFLDDVLLSPRSFVVRNRIRYTGPEPIWLSVRLRNKSQHQKICDHSLIDFKEWLPDIKNKVLSYYRKAPYLDDAIGIIESATKISETSLSGFNIALILVISDYLGLAFAYERSSDLLLDEFQSPEARMTFICKQQGARAFYNFKNGVELGLYSAEAFAENGIKLVKQDYDHPVYQQPFTPFISHLSIIDLIANVGPNSRRLIAKGSRWVDEN